MKRVQVNEGDQSEIRFWGELKKPKHLPESQMEVTKGHASYLLSTHACLNLPAMQWLKTL